MVYDSKEDRLKHEMRKEMGRYIEGLYGLANRYRDYYPASQNPFIGQIGQLEKSLNENMLKDITGKLK